MGHNGCQSVKSRFIHGVPEVLGAPAEARWQFLEVYEFLETNFFAPILAGLEGAPGDSPRDVA